MVKGAGEDFFYHAMYRREVSTGNLYTSGRHPHLVKVSIENLRDKRPAVGLDRLSSRGTEEVYLRCDEG